MSFINGMNILFGISSLLCTSTISYNRHTKQFGLSTFKLIKCILNLIAILILIIYILFNSITLREDELSQDSRVVNISALIDWISTSAFTFYILVQFVIRGNVYATILNHLLFFETQITERFNNVIDYRLLQWNFMFDLSIIILDFIWYIGHYFISHSDSLYNHLKILEFFIEKYYPVIDIMIMESVFIILTVMCKYLRRQLELDWSMQERYKNEILKLEIEFQTFLTSLSEIMVREIFAICGLLFVSVTRLFYYSLLDVRKNITTVMYFLTPLLTIMHFIFCCHLCAEEV